MNSIVFLVKTEQSEVVKMNRMHGNRPKDTVYVFQANEMPKLDEKAIDVEAALRSCGVAYDPDSTRVASPSGRRKAGIQERLDSQVGHRAVLR